MSAPTKANASLAGEAIDEGTGLDALQIESNTGEFALCEVAPGTALAAEYVAHGWALCQFDTATKGGDSLGKEWNTRSRAVTDPATLQPGKNVGLLHAWSRTCVLDCDDYRQAREWLQARGVHLDALLAADDAVKIVSGRENRAKPLFRVPAGVDPLTLRSIKIQAPDADACGKHPVWLELRCATDCGTKSVQDVLPPSIHPDTGKPYTWQGDWRELPVLPADVLTLWQSLADESPRQRKARGAVGPGTSAEVLDLVRRLQVAGLKPFRCGSGFRSHCPHHGGESGTTLKLDEAGDGRALWHCNAGCTQEQVIHALETSAPRDRAIPPVALSDQLQRAKHARLAANDPTPSLLPPFPAELLNLPHGAGELQRWILGFMTYPSASAAGLTALAVLAHFGMHCIKIDSRRGAGLNEQYLMLAPTGFGKEDLRAPFELLTDAIKRPDFRPRNAGNLWPACIAQLQFSAPASQQGLHKLLETHHAQTFLADEFAEWLGHAATDSHKQQALGHIMQAYSKAFGTLAAPAAVTIQYEPVHRPRVLIFATSTAERMLEAMTASQAESGALNRFVILAAEQERIAKRYDVTASMFDPPDALVHLVAWLTAMPETTVAFAPEAWNYHIEHDSAVLDPLRHTDNRLAGRLNEQAFKMAAAIALSDRRTIIERRDLAVAYAIREGLYRRSAAMIGFDGALSGMHATGRALEQVRLLLEAKGFVYRSRLPKDSRQFGKLSLPERESVLRALQSEGYAKIDGGKLVSLLDKVAA